MIINIHAINFRESSQYNIEMDRVIELVKAYKGALIIAGDFNSWSDKRIERLFRVRDELSLDMVSFKNSDKIKSFMGNQLDYIFYRDLKLISSLVIEQKGISDHNPLLARFKLLP
jgi:endonuclease/exonuclease/phosphatase (EEP) superfamily protein YafD